MATGTDAGGTWNTTAGNKTVTATPASGDLIVVIHGISGWASGDDSTITDNNSDGLGTYYKIGTATAPLSTGGGTASALWISVRNSLVGSASSTVFTATNTGDTGGGLTVLRFSGFTFAGPNAVRQYVGQSDQTENPTEIAFAYAALTGNPIVLGVMSEDNPSAQVPPTGFTEADDTGWNSPTTGIEVCWDDSGNTASTYTYQSGGAATDHNEVGIELNASTSKPFAQTGQTAINGVVDPSGDLSYKWKVEQSGQTTATGTVALSGDPRAKGWKLYWTQLEVPEAASTVLSLTQTDQLDFSGTLALSGDLSYKLSVVQSGQTTVAGIIGTSGDFIITGPKILEQSGQVTFAGVLGTTGDFSYKWAIAQSGQVVHNGVIAFSGDLFYKWGLVQSGQVVTNGVLGASGDLIITGPKILEQSGQIAQSGVLATSGDITYKWAIAQSGSVAESGVLAISGDISYKQAIVQVSETTLVGVLGTTGDITITAPAATFELTQSGSVDASGVLAASGDISYKWALEQSGQVVSAGQIALSGDISYTVPFALVAESDVIFNGQLGTTGDLAYQFPHSIEQTGNTALSGVVGISGDLSYKVGIVQTGSVAVAGVLGASGDLGYGQSIEQQGDTAIAGVLGLSGDITSSLEPKLTLAQTGEMSIMAMLGVAGDLEFSTTTRRHEGRRPRKTDQIIAQDDRDLMDIAPFLMALAESECC